MAKNANFKKEDISFEVAMAELESILETMQQEETTLDNSVALYSRAAQLMQICNEKLNKAQLQVDEISKTVMELEGENGI